MSLIFLLRTQTVLYQNTLPSSGTYFFMFRRPSATLSCRDFRMALLAKAHEVTVIVGAALRQRLDVVYLLGRNDPSLLLTHLTQWLLCNVSVSDTFPRSAVSAAHCRVSVVLLVTFILLPLMLLTEPAIRKLWTSRVGTRPLRFSWHLLHLALGIRKALTGLLP